MCFHSTLMNTVLCSQNYGPKPKSDGISGKSVSRAFECFFFQIRHSYNTIIVTELTRKTVKLFFSVKSVNIFKSNPF